MAYVTWKLVFLYDNNKSIYLNKYPYTMKVVRPYVRSYTTSKMLSGWVFLPLAG